MLLFEKFSRIYPNIKILTTHVCDPPDGYRTLLYILLQNITIVMDFFATWV